MTAGQGAGLLVAYDLRAAQLEPETDDGAFCLGHAAALALSPAVERLVGLVDPALPDLGAGAGAVELMAVEESAALLGGAGVVLHHVASPFETRVSMGRMIPPALRPPEVIRVVTLGGAAADATRPNHAVWRARSMLAVTADLVVCRTAVAAGEALDGLGLRRERVAVVGDGLGVPFSEVGARTVAAYHAAAGRRARRRARGGGQRTLTLVCPARPEPASPGGAALLIAGAASEHVPVHVATDSPLAARSGGMSPLSPRRLPEAPSWKPGPLVWIVTSAADARVASGAMWGRGGVAVVWEPDRLAEEEREAAEALEELAGAADALVAADPTDADLLRELTRARARVEVIPPPLGWNAAEGRLGHLLPFEAAVMLGPGRSAARAARPRALLLRPVPPRFGPLGPDELRRCGELALALATHPRRPRIAIVGDTDADSAAEVLRRTAEAGAPGSLIVTPWPHFHDLVMWVTAADVVVDTGAGSRSGSRALADFALLGGRPLATAGTITSLAARVVAALGGGGPGVRVPGERSAAAAADALLCLVGMAPRGAARSCA